jgi:hypothetical protein
MCFLLDMYSLCFLFPRSIRGFLHTAMSTRVIGVGTPLDIGCAYLVLSLLMSRVPSTRVPLPRLSRWRTYPFSCSLTHHPMRPLILLHAPYLPMLHLHHRHPHLVLLLPLLILHPLLGCLLFPSIVLVALMFRILPRC